MTDYIIIGAGPGGMDTAVLACAKGKRVILIEKDEIGGTCLNKGCIPTKTLSRSAQIALDVKDSAVYGIESGIFSIDFTKILDRKDNVVSQLREGAVFSLKGVEVIKGEARLKDNKTVEVNGTDYTADKIIIATGSKPSKLNIPGAEFAITSDEFLTSVNILPGRVTIIGGGVIGVELASILNAFGADVTVVEYCKEILPPFDNDIAKRLRTALSKRGIKFITSASVTSINEDRTVEYIKKEKKDYVGADMVIMAVGRTPVIPDGADELGIRYDRRGIEVDDNFMTSYKDIYAIGDVNGQCMLAHFATAQGKYLLGEPVNLSVIPSAVFTQPECSMVGLSEEKCKESGMNYNVNKVLFRANGKAVSMGETDGIVKLISDAEKGTILGVHICGPHASDLIAEPALAMANGLNKESILKTIHSHPTLTEIIEKAAQ